MPKLRGRNEERRIREVGKTKSDVEVCFWIDEEAEDECRRSGQKNELESIEQGGGKVERSKIGGKAKKGKANQLKARTKTWAMWLRARKKVDWRQLFWTRAGTNQRHLIRSRSMIWMSRIVWRPSE